MAEANNPQYETPTTLQGVRNYVTKEADNGGRSEHTVLLNVEHSNLKQTRFVELRMDQRSTLEDVKQRLYLHTGTRPSSMRMFLKDIHGNSVPLTASHLTLGDCDISSGDTLHLIDDDPFSASANGWLEDTSLVTRYVMSDEAYDKKENTYRKFKQKMREKDPNWSMTTALARNLNNSNKSTENDDDAKVAEMEVGKRVEIFPGAKRGVICFVGKDLHELPAGWWVGVRYDEPVGKNDGRVKGVKYFEAEMLYGGLVRPSNVKLGDFPPLLEDDESDDEI